MRRTGRPSSRGSTVDILTAQRDVRSPGPRGCRESAAYPRNPHNLFSGNDHRPAPSTCRVDTRVPKQPLEPPRLRRAFRHHPIARAPRPYTERSVDAQLRRPPVRHSPRPNESPIAPGRAMRERSNVMRVRMNGDASYEEPVTLPNHFGASAQLNSTTWGTLNSKRYEAFRSTAIERNPLSRSDCRP